MHSVLQNGTNLTFLTFCTTSIFDKRENVNICFVTRETQNCRSWTRNEKPQPPPPPPVPALFIVLENFRFRPYVNESRRFKKSPFWRADLPTQTVWAVNSRSHDLATESFYYQKSNKTVHYDKNNLLFWFIWHIFWKSPGLRSQSPGFWGLFFKPSTGLICILKGLEGLGERFWKEAFSMTVFTEYVWKVHIGQPEKKNPFSNKNGYVREGAYPRVKTLTYH